MDSRTLEVLGLPRIRAKLAGCCRTPFGRRLAEGLVPDTDSGRVTAELDRLQELLALGDEPDLAGAEDVHAIADRASSGSVLDGAELLRVKTTCAAIRRCRQFLLLQRERAPLVWQTGCQLVEQPEFEAAVDKALDETGEVLDTATPELRKIRREMRRQRNRLVVRLERMTAEHPDWFGDRPAVRRGRFVLPVRVEARDRMQGVIHESSATGHTLFIEPLETVTDQNALVELRGDEVEQVARVMRSLSEKVAACSDALKASLEVLAGIDLLLAKRRFALEYECTRPEIAGRGELELVKGRHPLLRGKSAVVPLDFKLPDDATVVLVSGPNAGGKTVAIKTLGLLSLMLGCGMSIPAGDGTRLPLFTGVFADIGDEQSLDADLSSFTAHLTRLKCFLEQADEDSLVLLDEIGSSTAPEEGAALAIAVLETLRDRGVRTIATSHFGSLKILVQEEAGMANAAMGFRDGRPTYRLMMGVPGESSAFDIAAGVGLPSELLDRAKARMEPGWLDLSERLNVLNQELEQASTSRRAADEDERRARRVRIVYEEKLAGVKRQEAAEQERLRVEREALLKSTRREIENLVRGIRESQAEHEDIVKAKRFIESELEQVADVPEEMREEAESDCFAVGDVVESRLFRRCGQVVEVDRHNVTVAFGQIRVQVAPRDLDRVNTGVKPPEETRVECSESYHFNPRLDIRGMTVEEADLAVGGFLDEAGASGTRELVILHGKGTGALQSLVRDCLRRDGRVAAFRFAAGNEGGSGVTLVELKGTE